ncbi:hypothetical protein [Collimonas sp.]|uniref:hypothetical protein n=1 Tax=Collimonas sp. TaxID=1963772 RepID=UPI002CAB781F|nr:hypothetical protein [Collimonas sp.]HWW05375.1 hypothetical protein [Collimonas sp.]
MTACSSMDVGNAGAKTVATGSAGGANAENANASLEHCDRSLGTIAIIEDTAAPWYGILTGQYKLGSTVPVLKLLVQQSNCFVVVERGRGMTAMMGERALQQECSHPQSVHSKRIRSAANNEAHYCDGLRCLSQQFFTQTVSKQQKIEVPMRH